jgi:hypothetical protein
MTMMKDKKSSWIRAIILSFSSLRALKFYAFHKKFW